MKSSKYEWLKANFIFWGLACFIAGGGVHAVAQNGPDVLAKLGLDPTSAKESALTSLAGGNVYNHKAIEAFKSFPVSARAAVVQAGLGWIRAYVETAEFKGAYQRFRDEKKPVVPAVRPSADETLKKQKDDFEKQIAQARNSMAGMDAETKKAMEANIRQMRSQMEAMEKDAQQKEFMRQMIEMARNEDRKRYEEQLKAWEENYPADYRILLKKRIADFLAVSSGVDFSAQLTPRGEKMAFAREDYERKPGEWKICFRAGREAVESARAFAKSWLAELEKNQGGEK